VLGHSIFADQNQTAGYTFTTQAVCPLLAGRSVAVVGNGPLNKRQRGQINAADVILRFNALNNWSVAAGCGVVCQTVFCLSDEGIVCCLAAQPACSQPAQLSPSQPSPALPCL
jgi:hypothetical protein